MILNAEDLKIYVNTYGGIGGYGEQEYHLKKETYEDLLIADEGTDYQTYIPMDDNKKELLKKSIMVAYETNNPAKELSSSCVTGIDHSYIFESGFTKLEVLPGKRADSIFQLVLKKH